MRTRDNTVYGVGINDFNNNVSVNGHRIKSYSHWSNMLRRCYDPKFHLKAPSYIGCTVCDDWLLFSNFKEWFDNNYREGYQLDKDILFKGNKIYSPETCCFVPKEINYLYTKSKATRGEYPIGVCYDKENKKFAAQIRVNNKVNGIGRYSTKKEAFDAYKIAKEANIYTMASDYYNLGKIGVNVYNAMLNYKVNIND